MRISSIIKLLIHQSTQKKDLQNRPIVKEDFQFAGQWGSRNYRPQVDS
jgi:hypothetical protein